MAAGAEVLTVYRDLLEGNVRDIALVRWSPDGVLGQMRIARDEWVLDGCPGNSAAITGNGRSLAVAWFAAPDEKPIVQVARSDDGGRTFTAPVVLDRAGAIGFVRATMVADGRVVVSWRARAAEGQRLRLAVVSPDGSQRELGVIEGGFPSYPSDYPLQAVSGDRLFVAWTDSETDRVRVAVANLGTIAESTASTAAGGEQ
jgi:hypothetical protein